MVNRLYEAFNLPPTLPPTAFSWPDHDGTRARFPDFLAEQDPAKACRDFMRYRVMRHQMPDAFIPQFIVLSATTFMFCIISLGIILSRTWRKQFWLFRWSQRPEGNLIIFNSTNVFVVFCGIYGFVLVSAIVVEIANFGFDMMPNYREDRWYLMIWFPVLIASLWNSMGLAHGRAGLAAASEAPTAPVGGWIGFLLKRPLLMNTFTLGLPVIPIILISTITIPYSRHADVALKRFSDWESKYATLPLNEDMLHDALHLWYESLRGYFWIPVGMCCWIPIIAVTMSLHHSTTAGLIKDLKAHIEAVKKQSGLPEQEKKRGCGWDSLKAALQRSKEEETHQQSSARSVQEDGDVGFITTCGVDQMDGRNFFPPIKMPRKIHRPAKLLIYLQIQYFVILLTGLLMGVVTVYCIIFVYWAHEHGLEGLIESTGFLAVLWASTGAGAIVFAAVVVRDVEQSSSALLLRVNIPHVHPSKKGEGRKVSLPLVKGVSSGSPWPKDLPSVPQSVTSRAHQTSGAVSGVAVNQSFTINLEVELNAPPMFPEDVDPEGTSWSKMVESIDSPQGAVVQSVYQDNPFGRGGGAGQSAEALTIGTELNEYSYYPPDLFSRASSSSSKVL